jgi:hypothetical protein
LTKGWRIGGDGKHGSIASPATIEKGRDIGPPRGAFPNRVRASDPQDRTLETGPPVVWQPSNYSRQPTFAGSRNPITG